MNTFILYDKYFKTYSSREVVIQVLLYFFPKPHRCPVMNPLNPVIFPLMDFPRAAIKSLMARLIITAPITILLRRYYTCIISSISRRTSSAVFSGSSGLCVSVLLDKIKACMSKSVATASSSLLKSSNSGLANKK